MAAIGGQVVSRTLEGRARCNIRVRYNRDHHDSVEALKRSYVSMAGCAQLPSTQVASSLLLVFLELFQFCRRPRSRHGKKV